MDQKDKDSIIEWFNRQKECMESSRTEENGDFIDGVAYGIAMAQAIVESYAKQEEIKDES